jgi:hypothetical protein
MPPKAVSIASRSSIRRSTDLSEPQSPSRSPVTHSPRNSRPASPTHRGGSRPASPTHRVLSGGISPVAGDEVVTPVPQPQTSTASDSSVTVTPLATTPAQQQYHETDIEQLLDRKTALSETLRGLELELKRYNNFFSIHEKHTRADEFEGRSEVIRSNNLSMREMIDSLRNSDRVLVTLREQQSAVDKHMRLRKAQIRQKEATIDIITRRCHEQNEGSRGLLEGIYAELASVDRQCKELEVTGTLAQRVCPTLSLRAITYHDEVRYRTLEDHLTYSQNAAELSTAADRQLEALREELAIAAAVRSEQEAQIGGPSTALRDDEEVAAVVKAHRVAWEREKARLLSEKTTVQRMLRDTAFHVRRGTNVKSLSQHPCPPTQDFLVKEVRELQLTVGELQMLIEQDADQYFALQTSVNTLAHVRGEEMLKWEAELQHQWERRQELERSIRQLSEYEEILVKKHEADGHVSGRSSPPFSPEGTVMLLDAHSPSYQQSPHARALPHSRATSHANSHVGTPAVSASEWSVDAAARTAEIEDFTRRLHERATEAAQAKRPRSVMDRLTAPTRSFASFVKGASVEQMERSQRLSSVSSHRPIGCKQSSTSSRLSPPRK